MAGCQGKKGGGKGLAGEAGKSLARRYGEKKEVSFSAGTQRGRKNSTSGMGGGERGDHIWRKNWVSRCG